MSRDDAIAVVESYLNGLAKKDLSNVPFAADITFEGPPYAKGELGLLNTHSMYGWNGSLEGKMMKYFGVVADFGAHYGGYTQAPVGGPVGRGSRQRQSVYGDVWPKGVIADRQVHAVRARAVGSGP
jgi:hypothetical protein